MIVMNNVKYSTFPVAIRGHIKASRIVPLKPKPQLKEYKPTKGHDATLKQELIKILGPSPFYTLVIDTETWPDVSQRLRILYYELRGISDAYAIEKYYQGNLTSQDAETLVERGFVLPNNFEVMYKEDLDAIYSFAQNNNIKVMQHKDFINEVFYPYVYYGNTPNSNGRIKLPARLLGHNLSFDLSALAVSWTPATGQMKNGFALKFCDCVPNNKTCFNHLPIRFRKLGQTKTLYQFRYSNCPNSKGKMIIKNYRGVFQDTMTLGAAITVGENGNTLDGLCKSFGLPGKEEDRPDFRSRIDTQYLQYLVTDVQQTFHLFRKELEVLKMFNITEHPERIYSNASVDKNIRRQIGIESNYAQDWDISDETIGHAMVTYHGGRSEARIRLKPTQIVSCDFTSQYPATNYLMNLQEFMTAKNVIEQDATQEIRKLLRSPNLLELLQNRDTWLQLRCIVELENISKDEPCILPVRVKFDNNTYNESLSYVSFNGKMWWCLADVIGSVLLTGNIPNISRAIKFVPTGGIRDNLKPIKLMGRDDLIIDITKPDSDLYIKMIGIRHQIKSEAKRETNKLNKLFLEAFQNGIKITVNAGVYGENVEFIVKEYDSVNFDISVYSLGKMERIGNRYDEPGIYNASVIGTLITGAGRLLLAIAERLVNDNGLTYAYCDTDSMSIAKPDSMPDNVFYNRVRKIVDWFNKISPYDKKVVEDFFKIEEYNYKNGNKNEGFEPLYALVISAKRYVLYNRLPNNKYILRKTSRHGLGQFDYRGYYDHKNKWPQDIPYFEHDCSDWIYILYYYFVEAMESGIHRNGLPIVNGKYIPYNSNDEMMKIPAYTQDAINHASDFRNYKGISHLRPGSFFTVLPPLIPFNLSDKRDDYILVTDKVNSPDEIYEHFKNGNVRNAKTGKALNPVNATMLTRLGGKLSDYFYHEESKATNSDGIGLLYRHHILFPDAIEVLGKETNSIAIAMSNSNIISQLTRNEQNADSFYGNVSLSGNKVSSKRRRKVNPNATIRLGSMFTNYSMPDILAATCIPKQTVYDLRYSAQNNRMNPSQKTMKQLTQGLQLLNPEREGGTYFEWRNQITNKKITIQQLAFKLGVTYQQMQNMWAGRSGWTMEQHNKLAEILGIE